MPPEFLRKIGHQIRDLVQTAKDLEEEGKSARIVRNQIEGLYRQTEDVSIEWSAEVQYVHATIALLEEQSGADAAGGSPGLPVLLSGESPQGISVRLESKPDFILYQRLAEGSELMPGFRPNLVAAPAFNSRTAATGPRKAMTRSEKGSVLVSMRWMTPSARMKSMSREM